MKKVLDLSTFVESTMEVKWPDGRVFEIGKPTQGLVISLMALQEKAKEDNVPETLEALEDFIYMVFSKNKKGAVISKEDISQLSIEMKMAIMNTYTAFIREVQSNPNS